MKLNYKKIIKYIILNITIILTLVLLFDYAYFKFIEYNYKKECIKHNIPVANNLEYKTYKINKRNDFTTTNIYKYFLEDKNYLEVINISKTKINQPIILFGCSYTCNDNFIGYHKLLSEYSNRPIFNFAFWGWGAQHTYYLTQNPKLYEIINKYNYNKPEFAIYTYISDHANRFSPIMNYFLDTEPYLNYKIDNKNIKEIKYNIFQRLLFKLFSYRYIYKKFEKINNTENYEKLYYLILNSYLNLKKEYPNIKFIVFEYNQNKSKIKEEIELFEKLERNGIYHISTKDLTSENLLDKKYTLKDNKHPNPEVWKLLVPKLVKKLEEIQ